MRPPKSKTFVPPSGRLDARYVLVGEQPGRFEVRERKVFVGPAGEELNKDLIAADIGRQDCYITNTVKDLDRHISGYIQLYKGNKLLPEPIISQRGEDYLNFLKWELSQTTSPVFAAVGANALFALTGRTGINRWRGSVLDCTLVPGRKVIPMFHPATVIRPRFQYLNKRLIIFDLKRMKDHVNGLYVPTERTLVIEPSFMQTMEFLDYIEQKGLEGSRISYDIEVFMNRVHKQISCISFATGLQSICIPFTDHLGDYFTISQEVDIWKKIARILENPRIRICGQNLIFDCHFLLRTYGIRTNNLDDTMVAQNTIMPDYPKGLDFITSLWTDHPYYKADGKAFFSGSGKYRKFWQYNAVDSVICDEAMPKQMEELSRLDNIETYQRQIATIPPLTYMMERGLKVNVANMEATGRDYETKINEMQEELNQIAGQDLNPNSPKQLKEYFFEQKGVKPFKKAGKITYNDDAMKRLIRQGYREAKLIQEIRRYTKLKSTYLDLGKIDDDGRVRCSYNPAGTRYSRFSSSANIWGTGGNQQNWPHHLQEFLEPDRGYIYYAMDLSQAENRIVAYVGNILNMIEAFEKSDAGDGLDVHSSTSRIIIAAFYGAEKARNIMPKDDCPLGDGTHSWRFWGKKANHGFNYDWGYRNFALKNEIPESEGKLIYTAYHKLYPELQQVYHAHIRHCLRTSRVITNLMGRRTHFLDQISGEKADSTFKEAYSCIPQGTVGDKINQHGINFIYYDQERFSPIELLRQVHDEIGFQIPLPRHLMPADCDVTPCEWPDHMRMLRLIKESLEQPLTTHMGRTFVIPAEFTMALNMNKDNKASKQIEKKLNAGFGSSRADEILDECYQTISSAS